MLGHWAGAVFLYYKCPASVTGKSKDINVMTVRWRNRWIYRIFQGAML